MVAVTSPAPNELPATISTLALLLLSVIAVGIGISPTVEAKVTITGELIPFTVAINLPGFDAVIVCVALPDWSTKATEILISPTTPISSP